MTIKKFFAAGLGLFSAALALSADWQSGVSRYLNPPGDYSGALAYLRENYSRIDPVDKQNALGLLAFLASKNGAAGDEDLWIVEYFETYKDSLPTFFFMDESVGREFFAYWAKWDSSYPLINETVLLDRIGEGDDFPPAWLEVGINLLNEAYYKISRLGQTLEGGLWPKGFHILRLPVADMYDTPGSYEFDLNLKAGGILIKKRLIIRIDVQTAGPIAPFPPASTEAKAQQSLKPSSSPFAGEVSLYIGDELVLSSRKVSVRPSPLKINIPGPSAPGTKPYLAPRKNDFSSNSFSIIEAVNLAYRLIKDLAKKKKDSSLLPPVYSRTLQLTFSFLHPGPSGEKVMVKTAVSLDPSKAELIRE